MRYYFLILAAACLASCGSPSASTPDKLTAPPAEIPFGWNTPHGKIALNSVSANPKFPCQLGCFIDADPSAKDRDVMIVTATVTNQSGRPVTLVESANFYSISVSAAARHKGAAENFPIMQYPPATEKQLLRVPAGGSVTFSERFRYSHKPNGELWLSDYWGGEKKGCIRIWDTSLRLEFSYGWYPDYLPASVPAETEPYVKEDISAYTVMPVH